MMGTQDYYKTLNVEKNASEEAIENVQNSPWKNRVTIKNISFQKFATLSKKKFDLIISNPPFFSNSYKNETPNLAIARHNDLLPFLELIINSIKLLAKNGKLAIILPAIQAEEFIELTKPEGLNLSKLTKVKPKATKEPNRFLMEFTKMQTPLKTEYLTIYNETGTDYTESYKQLTRDFYLKF